MPTELIRAFDVALIFDRPTKTIIAWARRGWLPGAVEVGPHLFFDKEIIDAFLAAGGRQCVQPDPFRVARHGSRAHAGGRARNDRPRRPVDETLARMVKPDPGVRDGRIDPDVNCSGVEPGRLLAR
ncbi:MAG TPA: hypothetical protein VML19_17825 [Verrucomicrobiae bacterium]|nr:hypothetical protein [Verrucomicrobiae bacterium]